MNFVHRPNTNLTQSKVAMKIIYKLCAQRDGNTVQLKSYYQLSAIKAGLLIRLLVPRPRRDRDYSRHNPRRDRDETFVIRGETETRPRRLYKRPRQDRDETFVLLPQALHGTMRDACAAMPYNTPPSYVISYAMPM